MNNTKIIIPARYGSSRLPGKPLRLICGKELILHVAERCRKVLGNENLFIATDSVKIKRRLKENKFNVIMTSTKCPTGTDRVAQASKKISGKIFINVQGDEPLINPLDIKKIINAKRKFPNHIICGFTNMMTSEDIKVHIPEEVRRLNLLAKACANAKSDDFKALWYKKMIDLALKYKLMDYVMRRLVH